MSQEWAKFSEPTEIDGKWIVTIIFPSNPEFEDKQSFETKEEALEFIATASGKDNKPEEKTKRQGNYSNANYQTIELTEEQKQFVKDNFEKMDLKTLTQKTFNNPDLNGHHTEGKSVRLFISSLSKNGEPVKVKTTADKVKKGPYVLNEHQKNSILAMINSENPTPPKEIFKLLFPDMTFMPLAQEYLAIARFIKESNEDAIDIWDEPVDNKRYKAPKNYAAAIGLVNRYVSNPVEPSKALYDPANMRPSQEKNIKALLSYMQSTKFILQASQYDKKADRDLFESTFVRQVQDKAGDLTPEEVDMYISVASETVSVSQIERSVIKQERKIDECLDSEDNEKAKLSMSLVESVNSLREKLDKSKGRLKGLIESVAGSRKDRLDNKANQNDALVNLINLWVQEKTRGELIALAKREHMEDAAEMERISSLEDSYALIAGMTKNEAMMGQQ